MQWSKIAAFPWSGFKSKLKVNICSYTGSLIGRDFKVVAQMALYLFPPYLSEYEAHMWLYLSKALLLSYNIHVIYIYINFRFLRFATMVLWIHWGKMNIMRFVKVLLPVFVYHFRKCLRKQRFIYYFTFHSF